MRIGSDKLTTLYILDASVAVKWVLSGELYDENAAKVKDDFVSNVSELCAPSLIMHEVANSVWKALKRKRIPEEKGQETLRFLDDLQVPLHELNWNEVSEVLTIASKLDITVYDACYLFLSEKMEAQLITADEKLYQKAKGRFEVLHVKDYV